MQRGFNQYMRRLTECPDSLQRLCERNFIYSCDKVASKFLLKGKHLNQKFKFNNVEFEFLGLFDNDNCLLKNDDGFYECNLNFVQNGFKLFYTNFNTNLPEPFVKNDLKFIKKRIKRIINLDYE